MSSDEYPLLPEHWKRCFTWNIIPEVEHQLVFTSNPFRIEESRLQFELELEIERQERPGIIDFTSHTLWLNNFKASPGIVGALEVFINRSRCQIYNYDDQVAKERVQISKTDTNHPLVEADCHRKDNLITLIWTQSHVSKKALAAKLKDDFNQLLKGQLFYDAVIQCEDRTPFKVHRAVLSARSTVFLALLSDPDGKGGEKVIKMDYPTEVVENVINFVYTSSLPDLTYEKALELMKIALVYELFDLRDACIQIVCRNLTVSNALSTLQTSMTYNVTALKVKVLRFLSQNRKKLSGAAYFNNLKNNTSLLLDIIESLITE